MHTSTLRNLKALVLTGIYVFYVLSWSLHHILEHGHHSHEVLTSDCHHSDNEQHIHGGDFLEEDCSLCHFGPTASELPLLDWQIETPNAQPYTAAASGLPTFIPAVPYTLAQPRAPPTFI